MKGTTFNVRKLLSFEQRHTFSLGMTKSQAHVRLHSFLRYSERNLIQNKVSSHLNWSKDVLLIIINKSRKAFLYRTNKIEKMIRIKKTDVSFLKNFFGLKENEDYVWIIKNKPPKTKLFRWIFHSPLSDVYRIEEMFCGQHVFIKLHQSMYWNWIQK